MTEPAVEHDEPQEPQRLLGPQSLQEMFGGRRGIIDGAVPPIVFVVANGIRHDVREAGIAAVAAAVVLLAIRLLTKGPTRHVFSGVLGVVISAAIAARSGRASDFFIPGVVLNAGYFTLFVLSVVVRKPIVGLVLKQFSDKPATWHSNQAVRRAYAELTLIWAGMYGLRVLVQGVLLRQERVNWLAATKIILGYPPLLLVLALTMPYLRWRTAGVPVETGDPVARAVDASEQPDPSELPDEPDEPGDAERLPTTTAG